MSNIFSMVSHKSSGSPKKRYSCPLVKHEDVLSNAQTIKIETVDFVPSKLFNDLHVGNDFNKYTLTDELKAGVSLKEISPLIPSSPINTFEDLGNAVKELNKLGELDHDVSSLIEKINE